MTRSTKIFKYVGKRLLQGIPIILAIVVINFFLLNLAEGDAVDVLAGEAGSATPEYMAQLRKKFGLDQPLPVQLMVYLKNVLSLDLGYSFRHDMPVNQLIFDRFAATGLLMTSTIILAVGFGISAGSSGCNAAEHMERCRYYRICPDHICNAIILGRVNDDRCLFAKSWMVSHKRHDQYCSLL